MSDKAKKLEGVKQEIRSVLLSQPKDMTVHALMNDYRLMVGRNLPFLDFGYSTPDEFLRSIPYVVTMNWSKKYNTYMLRAVADETTKHIEKLVSKQKTSKTATLAARRMMTAAVQPPPPPRFSKINNSKPSIRPYLSAHVKSEIYDVTKEFKNGLSLPNFLTAFRKRYGKELMYKNYGFYTLEDCLNTISEVLLRCENGEMRVYPIIEKSAEENSFYQDSSSSAKGNTRNDNKENKLTDLFMTANASAVAFSGNVGRNKTMNSLDDFLGPEEISGGSRITPVLKEQFKQIMKKNPEGIWVSRFPTAVRELTGFHLDHRNLGYYNLIDLFSDLPEIFRIEEFSHCKDDWKLFDASSSVQNVKPKEGSGRKSPCDAKAKDIYSVIRNIRLLLQANYEGISLCEFCGLYEANCDEQFDLKDYGFDSLPMFLDKIAESVPLKVDYSRKEPKVYYISEDSDSVLDRISPRLGLPSDIPSDAVVGCTEYKLQKIPEHINPEQFFPVYLTAGVDPSHIYIQLHGEDTSVHLGNLMDELEFFYCKRESNCYKVPRHCIISGIACAAVWPGDGRWHRILISSVPSSDSVVAFFVDYGTKERIPSDNLKFLRKKFMELPAQAIRSHLCRLRPSHGDRWEPAAKEFILNSFGLQPLMACLTQTPVLEESLPLVLCDVSGENDVFLNDVLVSKGLAKFATDDSVENEDKAHGSEHSYVETEEVAVPTNNQIPNMLPTAQPMPVLPSSAQENCMQMSLINTSTKNTPDASAPVRSSLNKFNNNRLGSFDTSVVNNLQTGGMNRNMLKQSEFSEAQPTGPHHMSHGSDSDVFESDEEIDDDDNPEVNSISKRYVKRLNLDDGYNSVHMVVNNDRPYMSSGDITYLLWNHDDPDFVRRKLKNKEIFIPNATLKEVGYEQLFYQLERFQVRGVKTEVTGNHYIVLFPLKNVIDILNIFGHPSIAIRDIIDNELFCFNPLDSFWKTISEEEFEESLLTAASNVSQQKITLYELKASLQALKFRKQTLKNQLYNSSAVPDLCREIEETESHCIDVEKQIKELQVKIVSYQREKMYD